MKTSPGSWDLSTIFTDADGDALTYKVSVNGADPVEAAEKYSYVCGAANATLKFTANDGKADSDKTYTVTLNVEPKTKLLLESGSSEVAVGTPFTSRHVDDLRKWVRCDRLCLHQRSGRRNSSTPATSRA